MPNIVYAFTNLSLPGDPLDRQPPDVTPPARAAAGKAGVWRGTPSTGYATAPTAGNLIARSARPAISSASRHAVASSAK